MAADGTAGCAVVRVFMLRDPRDRSRSASTHDFIWGDDGVGICGLSVSPHDPARRLVAHGRDRSFGRGAPSDDGEALFLLGLVHGDFLGPGFCGGDQVVGGFHGGSLWCVEIYKR